MPFPGDDPISSPPAAGERHNGVAAPLPEGGGGGAHATAAPGARRGGQGAPGGDDWRERGGLRGWSPCCWGHRVVCWRPVGVWGRGGGRRPRALAPPWRALAAKERVRRRRVRMRWRRPQSGLLES